MATDDLRDTVDLGRETIDLVADEFVRRLRRGENPSVGEFVDADAYVFVDSDVMLVRPVAPETFVRDGQLALFRVPGQYEVAKAWHRASARLLGLRDSEFFGSLARTTSHARRVRSSSS